MLSGYLKRLGSSSINVDYIHINATLSYIETLIIDTVWIADNLNNERKKDILLALNKVFRIQNDLFLIHYLESSKENITLTHHKTHKCICS
jgi:hypothetical protein